VSASCPNREGSTYDDTAGSLRRSRFTELDHPRQPSCVTVARRASAGAWNSYEPTRFLMGNRVAQVALRELETPRCGADFRSPLHARVPQMTSSTDDAGALGCANAYVFTSRKVSVLRPNCYAVFAFGDGASSKRRPHPSAGFECRGEPHRVQTRLADLASPPDSRGRLLGCSEARACVAN